MKIDESLAKGLCSRFFTEMGELIDSDLHRIEISKKPKQSRAGWQRLVSQINKDLKKAAINTYEGGGKRNPYYAICGLNLKKDREYNTWHERCLTGVQVFINYEMEVQAFPALYNVGEHAISRMFERGKFDIYQNNNFNIFGILTGFSQVSLWAAFWSLLLLEIKAQTYEFPLIKPVIPSSHGLFLCEIGQLEEADAFPTIEIRTFIGIDSLSNEQEFIRSKMLKSAADLVDSPLSLYPLVQIFQLDLPLVLDFLVHYRLADQIGMIAIVLCSDIQSDSLRAMYKDLIVSQSHTKAKNWTPDLEQDVERLGIRKFLGIIRAAGLRNGVHDY